MHAVDLPHHTPAPPISGRTKAPHPEIEMVDRFIVRRFHDKHFVDYFAGMGTNGELMWTDDEMSARAYRSYQFATDAINNLLMHDVSVYPRCPAGKINRSVKYNFNIVPVLRLEIPDERENRRALYQPTEDTHRSPAPAALARIEYKVYRDAAEQGIQAALADVDCEGLGHTKNPHHEMTTQFTAWQYGYRQVELHFQHMT